MQLNAILEKASRLAAGHLGNFTREYASRLNNIAVMHQRMGGHESAEQLHLTALGIQECMFGHEHRDVAQSLNNLAYLYSESERYEDAEPLYEEALGIWQRTLGPGDPEVATCLANIGILRWRTERLTEAAACFREALTIDEAVADNGINVVRDLDYLGLLLDAMGKREESEPLLLRAVEVQRETSGEVHPRYALCLQNLASFYRDMGRYREAEPLAGESVKVCRETVGVRDLRYADALEELARIHQRLAEFADAEQEYLEALGIRRALLGNAHPSVGKVLNDLGTLYQERDRFSDAEPLLRESIEITLNAYGEEHPEYIAGLTNLAMLYHNTARYDLAERDLLLGIDLLRKTKNESPALAICLNNLGEIYRETGRLRDAADCYRQSYEILNEKVEEDHPFLSTLYANMAELQERVGHYDAALVAFQHALSIDTKIFGEAHPLVANRLNGLAGVYMALGDRHGGRQLLERALKAAQASTPEADAGTASILINLSVLCGEDGDLSTAQSLIKQAIDIDLKLFGERHPTYHTDMTHLAMLQLKLGRRDGAQAILQRVRELTAEALGTDCPAYANVLQNLGSVEMANGDYEGAIAYIEGALGILDKSGAHPTIAAVMTELAAANVAIGRNSESVVLMKKAEFIDDFLLNALFHAGSERQRLIYMDTLKARLDILLSILAGPCGADSRSPGCGMESLLRRKAIALEIGVLQAASTADLRGRLSALRSERARQALAGPTGEDRAAYEHLMGQIEGREENLEQAIAYVMHDMDFTDSLHEAHLGSVAAALPEDSVLVEFAAVSITDFEQAAQETTKRRTRHYLGFILPAGDPDGVKMVDFGEADCIESLILEFSKGIAAQNTSTFSSESGGSEELNVNRIMRIGEALREALFDPLLSAINGRRRLVMSPDGAVAKLPFEILPNGDNRYLIDDYEISYLVTGRGSLRFNEPLTGQWTEPVVIADPDFNLSSGTHQEDGPFDWVPRRQSKDAKRSGLHFCRLPGTRAEGLKVARTLRVRPWLDGEALKARLRSVESPRILHVATHGFFLEDQRRLSHEETLGFEEAPHGEGKRKGRLDSLGFEHPLLRSGLALAGANAWIEDKPVPPEAEEGLLTALEATSLDLLNTELVVLSACDTGVGESSVGEGVFGLRRAFICAGARAVVMSLWKVSDLATAALMERFYDNLLIRHQGRAEALRNAALFIRELTVGRIRETWLSDGAIEEVATNSPGLGRALAELEKMNDQHRPFAHPAYWGAFICEGDPSPLKAAEQIACGHEHGREQCASDAKEKGLQA
jgi:CHAT domain-containing protein/tetratricopeptide (TPR) repeat protein